MATGRTENKGRLTVGAGHEARDIAYVSSAPRVWRRQPPLSGSAATAPT